MRHRTRILGTAVCAVALLGGPAAAKPVRYPAAHPMVVLEAPDDWAVAETPLGLEMQSPQKDSLVLVGAVARDKASVEAWSRQALDRMRKAGVVFSGDGTSKKSSGNADPSVHRFQEATAPHDRPYAFAGPPSVDGPVAAAEDKASPATVAPATQDLPTISTMDPGEEAAPGAMKAIGHFAYTGATLNGSPVDVELAVFPLGKGTRLLTEQQSGPVDARAVRIVRSLRLAGSLKR